MKTIKDVIHGTIEIRPDILKIIDTTIFQRLSHIKQLTSAEYVFPGARHTRKEHCIGAMHLASEYAKVLKLNNDETLDILTASLLHDIAHGSFSHSWDTVIYSEIYPNCHKGHDQHRYAVLDYMNLNNTKQVKNIWNGNNKLLNGILSGGLSVDRFDFLARDTFYTSTRHFGYFESDRIIKSSLIYTKPNGERVLAYKEKCIPDAIQGLQTRLYMYNKVYLHKTVIAASILIEAAIKSSKDILNFVERTKNIDEFIYLNDSVLDQILLSTNPELKDARYYANLLYERKLPKLIDEETVYSCTDQHTPKIEIKGKKIYWVSRILSNNFVKDFTKQDIHVKTKDGFIPFSDYWNIHWSKYVVETYYIKRTYVLG